MTDERREELRRAGRSLPGPVWMLVGMAIVHVVTALRLYSGGALPTPFGEMAIAVFEAGLAMAMYATSKWGRSRRER